MNSEKHKNVELVLAYLKAAERKNFPEARNFFTEDFLYEVSGENALAGTSHGPGAGLEYFGKIMAISAGTYRIDEVTDWLVSESRVLMIARESMRVKSLSHSWTRFILFTISDGKFSEVRIFEDDQKSFDNFLKNV